MKPKKRRPGYLTQEQAADLVFFETQAKKAAEQAREFEEQARKFRSRAREIERAIAREQDNQWNNT